MKRPPLSCPSNLLIEGNAALARQLEWQFRKKLVVAGSASLLLAPDGLRMLNESQGFITGHSDVGFLDRPRRHLRFIEVESGVADNLSLDKRLRPCLRICIALRSEDKNDGREAKA